MCPSNGSQTAQTVAEDGVGADGHSAADAQTQQQEIQLD